MIHDAMAAGATPGSPASPPPPGTRTLEVVCAFLMAVLVVLLFIQVFGRYALNDPPVWTEELARTVFLYATFIGSALALAKKAHLRIDAAVRLLPAAVQVWTQVATHLIAIVFLGFVVYHSALMLPRLAFQPLTALPFLSKAWFFASVPIGCTLMLLYELLHLWTYLKHEFGARASNRG